MRLRWIAIAAVSLFSIIGVYTVCPPQAGPVDSVVGMCQRVLGGMLFGLGFWGASHILRRWMSQGVPQLVPVNQQVPRPQPTQPAEGSAPPAVQDDCRYRVRGYDCETRFETVEFVYADSPSNAKMKVELKGVQVAAVERIG